MIRLRHLTLILCTGIMLFACTTKETDLEATKTDTISIEIAPEKLVMVEGHSTNLEACIHPWNAKDCLPEWSSSNNEIATVDNKGKVNAITPGEATITAVINELKSTCHITVKSSHIPAESIEIDKYRVLSVKLGTSPIMKAKVFPENATVVPKWTSSNTDIFTINEKTGVITPQQEGMAYLTVIASNHKATIPVQVHGDFWIEQTNALIKPVKFEEFDFSTDTIRVARREVATFQGIIYADENAGRLTPRIKRFALNAGSEISVKPKIYWVKDIKCSEHWDNWAGGRPSDAYPSGEKFFPDPLIPFEEGENDEFQNINLYGNQKQAIWVEFTIPEDLPAGLYTGTLEVESDNYTASKDFYVQVYDVSLPEKQRMKVIQWMHEVTRHMSEGEFDMHYNYNVNFPKILSLLNDYGNNCFRMTVYCTNNQHDVGYTYDHESGQYKIKYNFFEEKYRHEFEYFEKHTKQLEQMHGRNIVANRDFQKGTLTVHSFKVNDKGGLLLDENGVPILTYVTFPTDDPQKIADSKPFLRDYFHQFQEFLRSHKLKDGRTWLDIYVQSIADEPRGDMYLAYNQIGRIIKEGAPDLKIIEPIESGKIDPEVLDYPCPTLNKIDEYRATGNQVQWIYTCMQPQGEYANRFIRMPLFKTRLIHWVQFLYNAEGYLHWGLNYWMGAPNDNPWSDAYGNYIGGDMWIIWPGKNKVYPSIRLSAMRDGIKDYELLRMIEDKSPEKAHEFCTKIVKDNKTYNLDEQYFLKVRKEILEYLEQNK